MLTRGQAFSGLLRLKMKSAAHILLYVVSAVILVVLPIGAEALTLNLTQQREEGGRLGLVSSAGKPDCPVCKGSSAGKMQFKPAHFTCLSCDTSTCTDCKLVVCDLAQCLGGFAKEGGTGCSPWWWCDGNKPPGDNIGNTGFLQLLQTANRGVRGLARSIAQSASALVSVDGGKLAYKASRFVCSQAALAPTVKDPKTMQEKPAGKYIVFEQSSCKGSVMDQDCFCWDNFLRLSGLDPQAQPKKCDASCTGGECDGLTCGKEPPKEKVPKGGGAPPTNRDMPAVRSSEEERIPVDVALPAVVTASPA